MLYRCVLLADWLTPGLLGEWCMRVGSWRAGRAAANERDDDVK